MIAAVLGICRRRWRDVDVINDALQERRLQWEAAIPMHHGAFRWKVLGGRWTDAHLGVAFDVFTAKASPGDRQWCLDPRLPRESRARAADTASASLHFWWLLGATWCNLCIHMYDSLARDDGAERVHGQAADAAYDALLGRD